MKQKSFSWFNLNKLYESTSTGQVVEIGANDSLNRLSKPQTLSPPPVSSAASTSNASLVSTTSFSQQSMNSGTGISRYEVPSGPRIFALVVAIDEYKSDRIENLSGCKNDAKRFISYLTNVLNVPSSQILSLADENATRAEILSQFNRHFLENTEVKRNDAMVFFYAGHGCRLDAPDGWVSDGNKIETICPHDEKMVDANGNEIHGIPDRTIDALMRKLAHAKGNNIIAIFDSCHSGGISRSMELPSFSPLTARCIPPPLIAPPNDLDQEIWGSHPEVSRAAQTTILDGFEYKSMESHVLLAACRPDEYALEDPSYKDKPGGLFTTALVEALRRCSVHDTSYSRLFELLHVKDRKQHPQCQGTNKDRLLFTVNTIVDGETSFKVTERDNRLYVSAGSIHGVVVGTEFTIRSGTQTLVFKAKKVGAFECALERTHHSGVTIASAIVSSWNHPTLKVHSSHVESSVNHTVVPADEPADLAIQRSGSKTWEIERLDPLIPAFSTRRTNVEANPDRMHEIINAIANFNSYLYRFDGTGSFSGKIRVRLHRIGMKGGEFCPDGEDLLDVPSSSISGIELKEATITNLRAKYCFTLENSSDVDLFPYIFYFDPSDYSTQSWYTPPSRTGLPPLRRCADDGTPSIFPFGYDGFGTDPIEFYIPDEKTKDSGFLKVFFTSTYVEMGHVAQPSIDMSGSRGLRTLLKGSWTCQTFVLTCMKPGGAG